MNIRKKLILGLAGISLLVGVVGAFAIVTNRDIQRDVTDLSRFTVELNEDSTRMSIALLSIQKTAQELMSQSRRALLEPDEATEAQTVAAACKVSIVENLRDFEAAWSASRKTTEANLEAARALRDVGKIRHEEEEFESLEK